MSNSKFDGATFKLNLVPSPPRPMEADEGYVHADMVEEFEDMGFSDVKIPVLENWQLSGAKPNHCYRGMCGEKVFYCHTDEMGRGVFRHLPVSAFPGAVQAKKELSRIMGLWSGRPEGWQDFAEPKQKPINWRLAIDQAMTDIERDGSESALAALPWLADWLIIEAKSGMGDGDE